ncbi:DoxX family protein [Actibacterium sp. 188UL27-1]|uniref:DoxX family protein n=1 Tax=Actibacterium sp. 188UL27-1 TaxID=2786961 RepID=UPI001957DC63|nr:DoxX family protein [Actibacterium sp. 188UL27-1]MBM7067796.1 DoxX family protein [Actibacterium sp. 188UL27-1]
MTDTPVASGDWRRHAQTLVDAGPSDLNRAQLDHVALALRLGLGGVFLTGGWWKLSRALDPDRAGDLVTRYMAPNGYINAFFQDYLFTDSLLTPWAFLTALSAFELLAGIALILGVFIRPLAIIFGVLMWSFVAALPVLTTPGAATDQSTYLTPALIVQIRDVGLSGICLVLALIGSGRHSLDERLMARGAPSEALPWPVLALVLRISIALPLLAGGAFYGLDHVKSWIGVPLLLLIIGAIFVAGHGVRIAAVATVAVLVVFAIGTMAPDKSFWDTLNSFKREFAFLAAALVLARFSGGSLLRVGELAQKPMGVLFGASRV